MSLKIFNPEGSTLSKLTDSKLKFSHQYIELVEIRKVSYHELEHGSMGACGVQ
jgi:hypothetical protein